MKVNRTRRTWVAMILLCLGTAGCMGRTSAPTQFYMLSPLEPIPAETAAAPVRPIIRVSLDPVEIPEYLNRPQIVTRLSGTEYQVDEFNRWMEPLGDTLTRVITENLSEMLGNEGIDILSMSRPADTDFSVAVQVLRLDGEIGQPIVLVARWSLFDRAENTLSQSQRCVVQANVDGDSYQSLVQAHNRLIESLSREIASGIRPIVLKHAGS